MERACGGDTAFARAYLLYGTFMTSSRKDLKAYFGTPAEYERKMGPALRPSCRRPDVFCPAYRSLVQDRGEEVMLRVVGACAI